VSASATSGCREFSLSPRRAIRFPLFKLTTKWTVNERQVEVSPTPTMQSRGNALWSACRDRNLRGIGPGGEVATRMPMGLLLRSARKSLASILLARFVGQICLLLLFAYNSLRAVQRSIGGSFNQRHIPVAMWR
jgi:hypothetical protein